MSEIKKAFLSGKKIEYKSKWQPDKWYLAEIGKDRIDDLIKFKYEMRIENANT